MASKNEAKIKFSAETKDFDSAIKQSKNVMKDASAEMKLAAAEFKNTGNASDYYQKKTDALSKKLEANAKEQEALNGKIEVATEIYGEDSDQVQALERQLTYLQTSEQNILSDIDATNEAMKEQAEEAERSESTFGQLSTEIESQQTELDALKEEYINAYIEFGATSDEAQNLASQISSLSGELATNQSAMEEAKASADGFDQSMKSAGEESSNTGGIFSGAMEKMGGIIATVDIPTALGQIVDASIKVGEKILEQAEVWDGAMETMANATGAVGSALDSLMESNAKAYESTRNMNTSLEEVSAAAGQINTLFGYEGDELEDLTVKITEFSGVVGYGAVDSVNELYRITKLWGESAGTNSEVLDKLTVASQQSGASVSTITSVLTDCNGAMEGLGMSFDDGVSFLIEYCQAGGDASDVSRILQTAYQKLNGEVDDVPRYFQAALNTASRYKDVNEAMNASIGTTGMTISDVFGSGKAGQKIVSTMTDGKLATEDYSKAVEESSGALERTMIANDSFVDKAKRSARVAADAFSQGSYDVANAAVSWDAALTSLDASYVGMVSSSTQAMQDSSAFTDSVASAFGYLMDETNTSMAGVVYALATGRQSAEGLAEATGVSVDEINAAMDVYNEAMANGGKSASDSKDKATGAMDELDKKTGSATKNASTSVKAFETNTGSSMKNAQKGVSSAVTQMDTSLRAMANNSYSVGTVRVPQFSISGKLDAAAGTVPTIGVTYKNFARGGILAGIMNEPTIFGWASDGTALRGGEAGTEAILPIDLLEGYIANGMQELASSMMVIDYDALAEAMERRPILLNRREIRRAL